jgi:hypothetical protein
LDKLQSDKSSRTKCNWKKAVGQSAVGQKRLGQRRQISCLRFISQTHTKVLDMILTQNNGAPFSTPIRLIGPGNGARYEAAKKMQC